MKAIGVGFFWFASIDGPLAKGGEFLPENHLKEIKNALESVDNISNVRVSKSGEHYFVRSASFSADDDEPNFFPQIDQVRITFDIFIPERLEQKYVIVRPGDKGIESFHVAVVHDGDLPVCYVYYAIRSRRVMFFIPTLNGKQRINFLFQQSTLRTFSESTRIDVRDTSGIIPPLFPV